MKDYPKNWEETIEYIRLAPDYAQLVEQAYLDVDVEKNILRFKTSEEFLETLRVVQGALDSINERPLRMLDLGAGNGIATIAFAQSGFSVTALEPDPSLTIGAGAIKQMVEQYKLEDVVKVIEAWGESLPFSDGYFDLVYGRQVMHHAHDLKQFIAESARVLRPGGILLTTRDHVVKGQADKERFLARHPLHKYYGGENAFTLQEYETAMTSAGLKIETRFNPQDSPINYGPWSEQKVEELLKDRTKVLHRLPFVRQLAWKLVRIRLERLPGRLYSYLARKPK
jgi:SAM-dependent methyltransferase